MLDIKYTIKANIRLGRKRLQGTNTLAYFAGASLVKLKKSFITPATPHTIHGTPILFRFIGGARQSA
jgi:hypothetical protein